VHSSKNTIVPARAAGTARQPGFGGLLSKNHHKEIIPQWGVRKRLEKIRGTCDFTCL